MLYNYNYVWQRRGLKELWQQHNELVSPIHMAADTLGQDHIRILPAVHALTGCDTTSKISTKNKAFKTSKLEKFQKSLATFGEITLTEELVATSEEFLVECLASKEAKATGAKTFDSLRHFMFHNRKKDIDLDTLPCTSRSLRYHIQRSFLQTQVDKFSSKGDYCFTFITLWLQGGQGGGNEGGLMPVIIPEDTLPENFHHPCSCLKCAKPNVCCCRIDGIACCDFCQCKAKCNYTTMFEIFI